MQASLTALIVLPLIQLSPFAELIGFAALGALVARTLGTVLGAGLVWWLLQLQPSVWLLIGLIVVLKVLVELIIGMNYGLGQILVTPMALLMTYLALPQSDTLSLVTERISATVLGAITGVLIILLLSRSPGSGIGDR